MILKVFLGLLLAPILALMILAGSWGLADLHSRDPQSAMARWEVLGKIDNEARWGRAYRSVNRAINLNRGEASYDFYSGKLWEWKAMTSPVWSKTSRESRIKSIEQYKISLGKRPAWSLAWISIAQNKLFMQEMDEEAFLALENALESKWDPRIQFKAVWIGMAVWDHLPEERKKLLRGSIERLLSKKPWARKVIPMAVSQYREEIFDGIRLDKWPAKHLKRTIAAREKSNQEMKPANTDM